VTIGESVKIKAYPRKAIDMRRTLLSCALIGAIAAAPITFWNGQHRVTDPYQPDRRHRRRMKSPAKPFGKGRTKASDMEAEGLIVTSTATKQRMEAGDSTQGEQK